MIRFGVLGLGFMGRSHLASLPAIDGVEVAAVYDPVDERLNGPLDPGGGNLDTGGSAADTSGIRRADSVAEVLEAVDAVVVATPSYLHADLTCEALSAGKHVFCEKPMALSVADCDRMIAASKSAGKQLMIGHVLRFFGEYAAAASAVRSGEYGPLLSIAMLRQCGVPTFGARGWFADYARSGGPVLDLHIHDVDFTLHLLGAPRAVRSTAWTASDGVSGEIHTTYDYGPDGPVVTAAGGWSPGAGQPFVASFRMCFESTTLAYSTTGGGLVRYGPDGAETLPGDVGGYFAEMVDFVDAVRNGTPSETCPPTSSRSAVALALAEIESARTGQAIEIRNS